MSHRNPKRIHPLDRVVVHWLDGTASTSARELAQELGIPPARVFVHLAAAERAGLLHRNPDGSYNATIPGDDDGE